ncbi:MAG TPA: Gfo/Idh/MocA family oxidoreductase [Actinomycetota bacterium]|nr:Gfo/Idh/MocA family oxidoreductase [Actinomycetota bacterium]
MAGRGDGPTVRWGILGTGKIARIMAAAVRASQDGELLAFGSRDVERAVAVATEFGAPRHARYEDVVGDPDVDVVYVATHHPFHREWASRAADAGKHVLCEKPLAVTSEDARAIVDAAERNGVFLLEAFAYRSHPQTERLVELLRDDAIGEVRLIDAVFGYDAGPAPTNYLLVPELAGGSILDVGCYTTSMAHLVAASAVGEPSVEAVDVVGSGTIGPTGVDHSAAASLVFESGALARVACSIEANLQSDARIYGSEGRIHVDSPWLPGRIGRGAEIVVERSGSEPETMASSVEPDVYTVEADAVNAAILKGDRDPAMMPWEDSVANMRTLDRWRAEVGHPRAPHAAPDTGRTA